MHAHVICPKLVVFFFFKNHPRSMVQLGLSVRFVNDLDFARTERTYRENDEPAFFEARTSRRIVSRETP